MEFVVLTNKQKKDYTFMTSREYLWNLYLLIIFILF